MQHTHILILEIIIGIVTINYGNRGMNSTYSALKVTQKPIASRITSLQSMLSGIAS